MANKYGYKPSLRDHRDFKFAFSGNPAILPATFSLQQYAPFVFNQEQTSSCFPNAVSMALKVWMVKNDYKWPFVPSRLQIYYGARVLEGTVDSDSGTNPVDVFKVINSQGVCPEDETSEWNWSFVDDGVKFKTAPPPQCMKDAALHKCLIYSRVNQDMNSIKAALVAGLPLAIGISVYQSFEGPGPTANGIIPMPGLFDPQVDGHGLCSLSYDENYLSGPNSWGAAWGDKGWYHLPWGYVLNPDLCSDIWSVGLLT